MKFGGLSIFAQTLLLLVASLFATQIVVVALIVALPQPRPDFVSMSEIVATLSGKPIKVRVHGSARHEDPLPSQIVAAPPAPADAMIASASLTNDLAERLGTAPARVRLFFKPDQDGFSPFGQREPGEIVPMRRGEAMFFNKMIAAYDTGKGWRFLTSPERPLLSMWQRRIILLFGVGLLVLLPLAWFFARRLALPIRRFAEAADRLGRDASGPPVTVEGPRELRTAAFALNAMQTRIADYLRERTALIGAIAHDLRTPLARIAFRIESADDKIREPVQNDIEQMRVMIGETMAFVKGGARPAERVPVLLSALLPTLAKQACEMGRDVTAEVAGSGLIPGDPGAIERLFQNLINNALAYGTCARIMVTTKPEGVTVTVADNGPGLPPEMFEAVFDPFTRSDPSRSRETGGVGLGLTIARSIAEDHGGTLTLSNGEQGGLIATVRFTRK